MRISNSYLQEMVNNSFANTTSRLAVAQTQIASGVRIQQASDDPQGAQRVLDLQTSLAHISQYQQTTTQATAWMKSEDSALSAIYDQVSQIKTLAIQANNPLNDTARAAIAAQIDAATSSLVQDANAQVGSQYIFSGYRTGTAPFTETNGAVQYQGDTGTMSATISDGMPVQLSTNGATLFNVGGAANANQPDLFTTMTALSQAVKSGDQATISTLENDLDTHLARIQDLQGASGVRQQQVQMVTNQLSQTQLMMTSALSDTQDTDISSALITLQTEKNVQQAVSYVASTLSQGGLLQYLR